MPIKSKNLILSSITITLTLSVALLLGACGDTPTPTLVPLPASSGNTTSASGSGSNAAAGNGSTPAAGANDGTTSAASGAPVTIPTIADTTELQIDPTTFRNAGGRFGGGAAANGVTPTVKVYGSSDDVQTTLANVDKALTAAGYTKFAFPAGGGNGRPAASGTAGSNGGASGTPGGANGGFGGRPGGGRGLNIYTKQGAADILFNVVNVPATLGTGTAAATTTTTANGNGTPGAGVGRGGNGGIFANLDPATAQKLQEQLKGQKTLLIVTAAPGLAQNITSNFANRTPGAGFGNRGGNGTVTPAATTAK